MLISWHSTDTDTDILARILADTSDTRDFLKLFLRQAERHADILATILSRMSVSVSMSVCVSASWNASYNAFLPARRYTRLALHLLSISLVYIYIFFFTDKLNYPFFSMCFTLSLEPTFTPSTYCRSMHRAMLRAVRPSVCPSVCLSVPLDGDMRALPFQTHSIGASTLGYAPSSKCCQRGHIVSLRDILFSGYSVRIYVTVSNLISNESL